MCCFIGLLIISSVSFPSFHHIIFFLSFLTLSLSRFLFFPFHFFYIRRNMTNIHHMAENTCKYIMTGKRKERKYKLLLHTPHFIVCLCVSMCVYVYVSSLILYTEHVFREGGKEDSEGNFLLSGTTKLFKLLEMLACMVTIRESLAYLHFFLCLNKPSRKWYRI